MLYFQARLALEIIDKLIEISADTNLARPRELNASFSLAHLTFVKKPIEGKLPRVLEELRAQAEKAHPIAVPTSLELGFEHWILQFDLRVTEVWWTVGVRQRPPQQGHNQVPWEPLQVDPWLHAIAKALSAHADRPLASLEPAKARDSIENQVAAARRMEAAAAQITEQLGRVAIQREDALTRRQTELEASVSAQREQLSKERIQFEQEKAERDSRKATVVRRELLKETLDSLDEETSIVLSDETNQKRVAINRALLFAMLLGVVLIGSTLYFEARPVEKNPEALLRTLAVGGLVLFGTSLWYFVRWQDRWQQTHAAAELQNRKNRKDMLRASWLAELVIETGKDDKIQLPDALLEEMSHGLFVAPNEVTVTEHPLEVLFKRAGLDRLKIGKTGIELTKKPRSGK
jgi:hypothetical protein